MKVQTQGQSLPAIIPRRRITGMSAILLPMNSQHEPDWDEFCGHVERTVQAGLVPAINMDTGYANLIDERQRQRALELARETCRGMPLVGGVYVNDHPDSPFDLDAYRAGIDQVVAHHGLPIVFQSYGLTRQSGDAIVESYQRIGDHGSDFLAFELGDVFAPFGKIYDLDVYEGLLGIRGCIGAKHSSLCRADEWQRLQLRNSVRPDFKVLTGNDLAIDMIMYGSDYLLGLSTFAPDAFALRDTMWKQGDPRFFELNDVLQYLGFFVFRDPVPGYKHSAAQFLNLRGWTRTPNAFPGSPLRPDSDVPILKQILERISTFRD